MFRVSAANRPLRTPAGVEGLKMRIASSKALEAYERAVGAPPWMMEFSEPYGARRQEGHVAGTPEREPRVGATRLQDVYEAAGGNPP